MGPAGLPGAAGVEGTASTALGCTRVGGALFMGHCFMASNIDGDKDSLPSGCRPYVPKENWGEEDWYKLAQEFNDGAVGEINRGDAGGRCHNHVAVTSFSGGEKASVWVNERTFNFSPTYAGSTCKLYSAERTMAVYACTV
mmetsp:Transcript_36715/g.83462  ORF Transcript_36715/g.83462 Transcript_36715/m.83462 type:complete len:141 (-) Transcript_36715:281-703(-)